MTTPALEIGPDSDLCAAIRALPEGEELVLQAGDYRGGCKLRRGGRPGHPLVIRSADPDHRARLVYPGYPVNLLEIHAGDITIRDLDFWGSRGEVDGVRIMAGNRITVEDCRFLELGGIAIASTHTSVRGLTVRGNVIQDSGSTGMYFGCHNGASCAVTGLLVERNYIRGVTAGPTEIGYGIEVKLNSAGVIRDNRIVDTKGPGIMVYGSQDVTLVSLIERNFVRGSRTSSGIVVGGGPAIVRNNIAGWNFEAGIGLEDYHRRGLLRGIALVHNTVYDNGQAGISAPETGLLQVTVLNNAIHGRSGTPATPRPRVGVRLGGNVDCTWAACFTNPDGLDFSAAPGSLLQSPRAMRGEDIPGDDFFGSRRGVLPTLGAVERPQGPVQLSVQP
ncbi:MAG: right-handed parallel beta-helix repeat-containing protein [Candidatus Rokuibacteriota bacterium]